MKKFEVLYYKAAGTAKTGFWVESKSSGGFVTVEGKPTKAKLSAAVEIEGLTWEMDTEGVWWAKSKAGLNTKGMPILELVPVTEKAAPAPTVKVETTVAGSLLSGFMGWVKAAMPM